MHRRDEQVAEDPITDLESSRALAHRLDHAGDVDPQPVHARATQAQEQPHQGPSRPEAVQVRSVDGGDADSYEDLVAGRCRRLQVADLDDVRPAVAVAPGGPHGVIGWLIAPSIRTPPRSM